jgi:hypothetical protein
MQCFCVNSDGCLLVDESGCLQLCEIETGCSACLDGLAPEKLQLVVTGMTDGTLCQCGAANGTWICEYAYNCVFISPSFALDCGDCTWQVSIIWTGGTTVKIEVSLVGSGFSISDCFEYDGASLLDCFDLGSVSIPQINMNFVVCNTANATATVSNL